MERIESLPTRRRPMWWLGLGPSRGLTVLGLSIFLFLSPVSSAPTAQLEKPSPPWNPPTPSPTPSSLSSVEPEETTSSLSPKPTSSLPSFPPSSTTTPHSSTSSTSSFSHPAFAALIGIGVVAAITIIAVAAWWVLSRSKRNSRDRDRQPQHDQEQQQEQQQEKQQEKQAKGDYWGRRTPFPILRSKSESTTISTSTSGIGSGGRIIGNGSEKSRQMEPDTGSADMRIGSTLSTQFGLWSGQDQSQHADANQDRGQLNAPISSSSLRSDRSGRNSAIDEIRDDSAVWRDGWQLRMGSPNSPVSKGSGGGVTNGSPFPATAITASPVPSSTETTPRPMYSPFPPRVECSPVIGSYGGRGVEGRENGGCWGCDGSGSTAATTRVQERSYSPYPPGAGRIGIAR